MSNKTDVSIVYISKTKNSSFFKTFLMKKHGVAVLFDFESELSPFLTCFPYRRSPSVYFEGTHGVRSAWGNTDAIDFVAIASSLQATNGRRAVGNTNRLKAVPLRFVRQLRTQTAQSLVLSVKLGAPFLAALRLAFRLVRLFAKLAFINGGFCSVPQ